MKTPLILRNRDMFLLWIGQLTSQAGIRMYQIAVVWWIVSMGGSVAGRYIGGFMVIGALPSVLFVSRIGRFVDATRTKWILVGCDAAASGTLGLVAALLWLDRFALSWAYLAGLLVALLQACFDPCLNKAVAEIVPPEDVERAVAFQMSTQSLASFGGAVAAAVLIERLGLTGVAVLNTGTYLFSALCNASITFRYSVPTPASASSAAQQDSATGQTAGWRLLDKLPLLRWVLIGFGCVNFFLTPILIILPLYTKQTLAASPTVLGMLEASLWIGLVVGSFSTGIVAFVKSTIRVGALCVFAGGLSLSVPGLIVDRTVYLAMLFCAGLSLGINNVKFVSLFQTVVPSEIKGRFFALMQALISFTFPISYFAFGCLADVVSPPRVCLIQGIGIMILSGFFLHLARFEDELIP